MAFTPTHTVCWIEIPVTDLDASQAFYAKVFDWDMTRMEEGPNPTVFFKPDPMSDGVSGHLYPGKPSENGPTIHLVVPDSLKAAKERCASAGGKLVGDDTDLPVGTFCYAHDLDGNSIGLFEAKQA
ncbi:VOC family protein [Aestuariibius insulae]|uniref:VOC family protein n=1 Tax=Aestuariibius insulae TaxID=2058287 RepID=UPI00345ED9C8